jgi:hypothetical protein
VERRAVGRRASDRGDDDGAGVRSVIAAPILRPACGGVMVGLGSIADCGWRSAIELPAADG